MPRALGLFRICRGLVLAGLCVTACVAPEDGAGLFLDAGLEQAAALAAERRQPLFVFCSSSADADSQRMLAETFAHADVVERLAERALIVHLPVDENAELARGLGVEHTPVILRMEGGVEASRREGFLSPWVLIGFVETQRGFGLAEWDALARDELADPDSRFLAHYERRQLLIERGEPEALLERDVWMWRRGLRGDSHSARSMFLGQVAKYAEHDAPTRRAFEAIRDETRAAVDADPGDATAWEDWSILSRHFLGGQSLVASATEALDARADPQAVPERLREIWFEVFMGAEDFERAARLCPDFGARFARRLDEKLCSPPEDVPAGPVLVEPPSEEDLTPGSGLRELRARFLGWMFTDAERWAASSYVAAALAMSRDSQAREVALTLLARWDDDRSRVALIDGVLRAETWWHARGLYGSSPLERAGAVVLEWLDVVEALRGAEDPEVLRLRAAVDVGA